MDGKKVVTIHGQKVPVRASIRTIVEQYLWQLENAPDVYRFVTQGTDGSSEDPVGRFAAAVADLLVEAHRRHAPTERWLEPAMARYWAAGVVGDGPRRRRVLEPLRTR